LESDSNVTVDKSQHPKKQASQMTSTLDGIHIDDRDEQSSNNFCGKQLTLESGSNVTVDNLRHSKKQHDWRSSTLDGIQKDGNKE
jgi:hypothetical protein